MHLPLFLRNSGFALFVITPHSLCFILLLETDIQFLNAGSLPNLFLPDMTPKSRLFLPMGILKIPEPTLSFLLSVLRL